MNESEHPQAWHSMKKIVATGNSLCVILHPDELKALRLKRGDIVEVTVRRMGEE